MSLLDRLVTQNPFVVVPRSRAKIRSSYAKVKRNTTNSTAQTEYNQAP